VKPGRTKLKGKGAMAKNTKRGAKVVVVHREDTPALKPSPFPDWMVDRKLLPKSPPPLPQNPTRATGRR
jgi:hypothetical protein